MPAIEDLSQQFDINELENQLESVIASQDPVGYMKNNINWEIDKDLDDTPTLTGFTNIMKTDLLTNKDYELWNPFRKFLEWLSRNKVAKTVKKVLCSIATQIQELIDAKESLKKILTVALSALVTAIGLGSINPVVLTLVVGLLATMILKGVANACAV